MAQMIVDQMTYEQYGFIYPGGFDGGNTDTCFTTTGKDGHEVVVVIPSAVVENNSGKLDLLRSAVALTPSVGNDMGHDPYKQDITLTFKGKTYLVGYSAMRQSKLATTQKGDDSRYYSPEQLVRLLAVSALAIPESHYEINLVTTAPIGYFTKTLRKSIRKGLDGLHVFTLNGIERHALIHVKEVMIEGPAALVLYGANSANDRRIIIDGGGHTTEFLTLDGRDPVADLCRGVEIGVETIGDYVHDQVLEQYNRRLSMRERSDILRAYGSRNTPNPLPYPIVQCGRHALGATELSMIARSGAQQLANRTLAVAAELWGKVNDVVAGNITFQYHVGGAPLFCNEEMQEQMPNLIPVAGSSLANARGSARIAKVLG